MTDQEFGDAVQIAVVDWARRNGGITSILNDAERLEDLREVVMAVAVDNELVTVA